MAAKLFLTVLSGPIQGKVFEFKQHDTFIFGRGTGCHAQLPGDPKVSRHHFLLEINPPMAMIRDLGSLNGTRVNGVRYGGRPGKDGGPPRPAQVRIESGDTITVGNTTILVQVEMRTDEWDPEYVMPLVSRPAASKSSAPSPLPDGRQTFVPEPLPDVEEAADSVIELSEEEEADGPLQMPESAEVCEEVLILEDEAADESRDPDIGPIKISGYRLERVLGEGGMGRVYAGARSLDELPVAVKIMLPKIAATGQDRIDFLRKIDVLRGLNHPNIVTLLDNGLADKAFYFVVEYCNGGNLADLADRRGGKLPLEALKPIIMQSLAGLDYAHRQGLVHRDLKPQNILLHQHGGGWVAKLGDLGIAKYFEQAGLFGMRLTCMCGSTFDFMPREQVTNFKGFEPSSDVWSIAATFYRAITGVSPRNCPQDRDPMEVVLCEKAAPIRQRNLAVPLAIAAVIDRALANEPKERFQNAGEMLSALTSAWQ